MYRLFPCITIFRGAEWGGGGLIKKCKKNVYVWLG